MLGFIKKVFGTKYDKDVKAIQPYVTKTNEFFGQYGSLSHDELRDKTLHFRSRIAEYLEGIDQEIQNAKDGVASESDLSLKEDLYREIDQLTKDRDKYLEEILLEILPEAFAVVKETARRFSENPEIKVTATQQDRDLAAAGKDFLEIQGDTAIYKNTWLAACLLYTSPSPRDRG